MGKRPQNQRGKTGSRSGSASSQASTTQIPTRAAAELRAKAAEVATTEELDEPDAPPELGEPSLHELQLAIRSAHESKTIYDRAADLAGRRRLAAEQDSKRAEDARETADRQAAEVRRQSNDLTEQAANLKKNTENLDLREQDIAARELAAEAGFRRQQEQVVAEQRRELDRVTGEVGSAWDEFAARQDQERQRVRDRLEREDADRTAQSDARVRELAEQSAEVAKQRGRLRAEAGQLQVDSENLEAERARFEARVAAAAGRQLGELHQQLATTEELLNAAKQETDRIRQQLGARQRELAAFDGLGVPEAAQRLRQAEADTFLLRQELAERPTAEAVRRLREVADAHRGCDARLEEVRYAKGRLEAEVNNTRLGVADLERLRDAENSYRLIIDGYRAQVRDLEDRYGELTERKSRASAFPGCSSIDADPAMLVPPRLAADPPELTELVDHVQSLMAYAEQPLYYDARDVRSFLAGLATSHLHLLEGISGTGKTSLPRAFAAAIGAGHELVEVQAGWRDRHDLLGYYNTFERTFHESKFLKALYMAGRPTYAGRPFFIVLDEMNLSHVEYYFADLLSKLENPDGKPIELLPAPVGAAPDGLVGGGTGIALPDNVWFIGTANNDETTLTFADKTYDRAYLLELPANRVAVETASRPALTPLSTLSLATAFERAKTDHGRDGERVVALLNSDLRPELQRLCSIGWGPRVEEQARTYTAVVCGAGGRIEEAADHVLATKLLRKVRGQYQIRRDHLSSAEEVIRRSWKQADLIGEPEACFSLLADEQRKR